MKKHCFSCRKTLFFGILLFCFINTLLFTALIKSPGNYSLDTINIRVTNTDRQYLLWNISWSEKDNYHIGRGLTTDLDGNIYVTGYTDAFTAGMTDIVVMKYYPNGTRVWNITWGGALNDYGYDIKSSKDGYLYCVGASSSVDASGRANIVLIKYSTDGTELWNTSWGGDQYEYGYGLAVDENGYIYVVGCTNSYGAGGNDGVILKFSSNGTKIWNVTWGGVNNDLFYGIALGNTNELYIIGETVSFGMAGSSDMVLLKYDSYGNKLWNVTWGRSEDESGNDLKITSEGNIIATGTITSFITGQKDIALVKFSSDGTELWNVTWSGSQDDEANGLAIDNDGYIYICGCTSSIGVGSYDIIIAKFDQNGKNLWNLTWGGSNNDKSWDILLDSYNNIYVTGTTNSFGFPDYKLVLLKYDRTCPWSTHPEDEIITLNSEFNLTWYLYDANGGGYYSIQRNGSLHTTWTAWNNNTPIVLNINTSTLGTWNYTIFYNDSCGNYGIPDTVLISIIIVPSKGIPTFAFGITTIAVAALILWHLTRKAPHRKKDLVFSFSAF